MSEVSGLGGLYRVLFLLEGSVVCSDVRSFGIEVTGLFVFRLSRSKAISYVCRVLPEFSFLRTRDLDSCASGFRAFRFRGSGGCGWGPAVIAAGTTSELAL